MDRQIPGNVFKCWMEQAEAACALAAQEDPLVTVQATKNVRKRIMTEMHETSSRGSRSRRFSGKDLLKSFFQNDMQEDDNDTNENGVFLTKPIADYFSVSWLISRSDQIGLADCIVM